MIDWLILIILLIAVLAAGGLVLFLAVNLYFSILTRRCPYLGTSPKTIGRILKEAKIKEGQKILELGCGDGRFLRQAGRDFKISGRGIDIHGWAILKAKILARFEGLKNIEFERSDIFRAKLAEADIIYLFLTREILEKLAPKLRNEMKTGALLISHGFEMPEFQERLFKTIEHEGERMEFQKRTYFYRIGA